MTITFNLFSAFGGRPFRVQKRTIDRSTTNLYSDLIFFVLVEGSLKTYFVNLIFRKIWMTEKAVLSHSRIFFSFFSQRRRENIKLGRSLITATPFSRTTVTTTTAATTAATTTTNAGCRYSTTNEKLGNRSTQLKNKAASMPFLKRLFVRSFAGLAITQQCLGTGFIQFGVCK